MILSNPPGHLTLETTMFGWEIAQQGALGSKAKVTGGLDKNTTHDYYSHSRP